MFGVELISDEKCPYPLCGRTVEECPCPDNHRFGLGCDGYPWANPAFVEAAKKTVEARKEDAERAEKFMQSMYKELRKKAKTPMTDDPFKNGWCFCPKCSHLRSSEKPWWPTCSVCSSTGKVPVEAVCPYRICGRLREECICPTQKVELPMTDRSAIDILKDPPKLITKSDLSPNEMQDAWFKLGEEAMRTKVVEYLEQRASIMEEAAKTNKWLRREAMALSEAAETIRCGKEIPGGFDQ